MGPTAHPAYRLRSVLLMPRAVPTSRGLGTGRHNAGNRGQQLTGATAGKPVWISQLELSTNPGWIVCCNSVAAMAKMHITQATAGRVQWQAINSTQLCCHHMEGCGDGEIEMNTMILCAMLPTVVTTHPIMTSKQFGSTAMPGHGPA